MEIGNLIRMANRIGQFFEAMPLRPEVVEGVANHIHKFWEPRMRNELDFLARHPDGDAGEQQLHPLVLEAVTQTATVDAAGRACLDRLTRPHPAHRQRCAPWAASFTAAKGSTRDGGTGSFQPTHAIKPHPRGDLMEKALQR